MPRQSRRARTHPTVVSSLKRSPRSLYDRLLMCSDRKKCHTPDRERLQSGPPRGRVAVSSILRQQTTQGLFCPGRTVRKFAASNLARCGLCVCLGIGHVFLVIRVVRCSLVILQASWGRLSPDLHSLGKSSKNQSL